MHPVVKVVTQPAYEPIPLAVAKAWLRIESSNTDHDAIVRGLIKAMRERAENLTARAYVERTLRLYLADWPWHRTCGALISLPHPPLISVSSFQYVDADGDTQTLATTEYVVHDEREPAIIVPEWDSTWPTIRCVPDAIQVTYKAGYAPGSPSDEAANQENIPEALKTWMQLNIATLFDKRDTIVIGQTVQALPRTVGDSLLDDLVVGSRLF